jgi:XTP/dITP diphosphohydrolase
MQKSIYLVTGNPGKLAEWQRLFPTYIKLIAKDIDIEEIQSDDLETIAIDKARKAYAIVKQPVLVEDVAAGLDWLHGLPGQFIKFFEHRLGVDALFQLAKTEGEPATATCTIAYYDGQKAIVVEGTVHGSVVAPRGSNGFGFDTCFVPKGQTKTYGEMTTVEKDALSHRSRALTKLINELEQLA